MNAELNKVKVIYCYKQKDDDSSTYKIGKADQRTNHFKNGRSNEEFATFIAKNRIKEQQTAITHGELELVYVWDVTKAEDSTVVEHAIHKAIILAGHERLDRIDLDGKKGLTEWFTFLNFTDPDAEVIEFVTKVINKERGESGLFKYHGRGYQNHVKEELLGELEKIYSIKDEHIIGCELAARFGKTLWALDLFKTLSENWAKKQYMILPAYVLTACSSFRKEIAKFSDFNDFVFVGYDDPDFVQKIETNVGQKMVITVSLHQRDPNKYNVIANLDDTKKVAFIDEADFGAHTQSSRGVLDALSCPTKILMTGTAIERAIASHKIDAVIRWSYVDMLLLKSGEHPILDGVEDEVERANMIESCAPIVQPKMFKMKVPKAESIQKSFPDILQTKWSKLLADVDGNKFTLESIVKAMFANQTKIPEMMSLSLDSVTPADVSMIFGGFKNKIQHKRFVKLTQNALGDNFVVLEINGDKTTNSKAEEKVIAEVQNAIHRGKRVIIVSKDMAARSFSIPEIDTVFLMYDGGLLSQTIQKCSRAFTPGKTYRRENKTEGTIVSLSLNGNREEIDPIDLYILSEANSINAADESLQESAKRILNSVNIFQNDLTYGAIEVDKDEYAEGLLKRSSLLKVAMASLNPANIDKNDFIDALLCNRTSSQTQKTDKNVAVDISKARTTMAVETDNKKAKKVKADEEKQFLKNVIFFVGNITALKDIDNHETPLNVSLILDSIEKKGLQWEAESHYGLRFNSVRKLIEKNIVPVKLLNSALYAYKAKECEI